jgi:hypothetical protein
MVEVFLAASWSFMSNLSWFECRRSEHERQRMDRAGIGAPSQSPARITCRPGPKLRQISPHTGLN